MSVIELDRGNGATHDHPIGLDETIEDPPFNEGVAAAAHILLAEAQEHGQTVTTLMEHKGQATLGGEFRDHVTGVVDYQRTWEAFGDILEPGTTEYEASVPVSRQNGANRPSINYEDKTKTRDLPIQLSIRLTTYGEPITVTLMARDGELMGHPISRNHHYGQTDLSASPKFTHFTIVLQPGHDPVLTAHGLDEVRRLPSGRPVEAFQTSGLYEFLSPVLVRGRGKLRWSKVGRHIAPDGAIKEVPPLGRGSEA